MLFGRTSANRPSRFTGEIPAELLEQSGRSYTDRSGGWQDPDFDLGFDGDSFPSRRPSSASGSPRYAAPPRAAGGSGGFGERPGRNRNEFDQRPRPAASHSAPSRSKSPLASRPDSGYTAPKAPSAAPLPAFQKGDMLEHKAFGRGMVLSIQKMGGDALIEIAFDNVGTKRLMLKSAAQHMKKL